MSGRLAKGVSALRGFEKQASTALKAYEALRKSLAKPLTPSTKKTPQLTDTEKAAKLSAGMGAKQAADATRLLRIEREKAKLVTDQTRAAREQARLGTESATLALRIQREEARLTQANARARQTASRASRSAELADIRLLRERMRLKRDADGSRGVGTLDGLSSRSQNLLGAGNAFKSTFDTLSEFARPALEQIRAEARFRMMGFPEQERAGGMEAVEKATQTVKGVKRSDAIETLTALTSTFGDVGQASQFLDIALKYRANMQTLYGDKYGPAEISKQISNTFKSLELLGVDRPTGPGGSFTGEDRTRMESYFSSVAQATAATGGDINPAEFRSFAKYGRTAVMGLSPEGLQKLLPLVQQLGGAQTGTALMSLNQNLIGGQMPQYKLREWERIGLLDKSKVEYTKAGLVKRMRPGAIPMAETLLTDPMLFADKLSEKFSSMGIDTKDFNQVNKQLYSMLGNRTSAGALSQMINYRSSLDKEAKNYERALGVKEAYGSIFEGQNPLANFVDLQAKWNDAKAREAMSSVGKAGNLAGAAAGFMGEHPDFTSGVAGVLALGKASTEAASGVGLLRDAVAGLGGSSGSGGGGGGGIAGTGVGVSDVAGGTWLGTKALKSYVGRAAIGLLGGTGAGVVGVGALAGLSAYGIHSEYEYQTERRKKTEDSAASQFEQIKKLREQSGGTLPEPLSKKLASEAFGGIDRRGLLNELDIKTYGTAGYPGVSVAPVYDRDATMAGAFARRAPELQFPELMRGFIEDIRGRTESGQMPKKAGDWVLEIAKKAFPESFTKAAQSSGESLKTIGEQSKDLSGSFKTTQSQSDTLSGAIGTAGYAASSFADKVNSLKLTPPSVPFVGDGGSSKPGKSRFPYPMPPGLFGEGREKGGPVHSGRSYVVGERGLEVFTPSRSGFITPNHKLKNLSRRTPGDWLDGASAVQGGAGVVLHFSPRISVTGSGDPQATAAAIEARLAAHVAALEERLRNLTSGRRLNRVVKRRMRDEREVA